jgi:20S proteasome alpha/beta subunit
MTVCIAALAEEGRSIVCMSDRALSYGDTIQWDSDSSKMFSLRDGGLIIMFAGNEESTSRIIGKVISREAELGDDIATTRRVLEEEYKEAVQEIIEARYLAPRLITKEEYVRAISGLEINTFIESIAKEVKAYIPDTSLIVCGFDKDGKPFILFLDSPGVVTDMTITGFHSIGSGWEKSISKFLYSEFSRKDPLHVVMYDMFDAKAFAEMAVGVGFDWETRIITGHDKGVEVPNKIDLLVERGWAEHEHHPFAQDPVEDPPPKKWKSTLRAYAASVVPPRPEPKKRKRKSVKE